MHFFFTKWLTTAILDDRKSISMAFLDISDRYATLIFFSQNGWRRPFWMTDYNLRSHFSPFQINTPLLYFFHKIAAGGHLGWPKITFDYISRHFRSICNFFFTKWLAAGILDDRISFSIAFITISDQYATFLIFFQNGTPWCYSIAHRSVILLHTVMLFNTQLHTVMLFYYTPWCYFNTHRDVILLHTVMLFYYTPWCYSITHCAVILLHTMMLF